MIILTDKGEIIKTTEVPRWNEFFQQYYASGFRLIKTRGTWSGQALVHSFKSFTETADPTIVVPVIKPVVKGPPRSPLRRKPQFEKLVEDWDFRLKQAFLQSVYSLRDAAQLDRIAAMIEAGNVDGAIAAVGLDPVSLRPWDKTFSAAFEDGGVAGAGAIPLIKAADGSRVRVVFNIRNPQAERWLLDYSSKKVTEIVNDQRNMLRFYLTDALAKGTGPRKVALDLVGRIGKSGYREGGMIGLTESQAKWVVNYSDELQGDNPAVALNRALRDRRFDAAVLRAAEGGEPLSADEIDSMVKAYTNRALRLRAETIARTEAMAALHQAQSEAFDQAVLTGAISADQIGKTWRTAGDDRVRDTHETMEGQTVGMDELFVTGGGVSLAYPGDPSGPPEEIINCRCYMEPAVDFLRGIA